MDPFDDRIMNALKDERSRDFNQLLDEVSFSHNTLRLHLNNLVEKGLVAGEKMTVKRRGRPRFTYSMPRILTSGIQRLLRIRRGGFTDLQGAEAPLPLPEGREMQED